MKLNDLPPTTPWALARRAEKMNPSVIREILKVTERPGIISFAGGLPSPKTFPVDEFAAACDKVLRDDGPAALQYAASEGYGPLREMVAAMLPWQVDPAQVLITTGSQQGLDLVGQGADRCRRARPGRDADLPGRAAGLRADGAGSGQRRQRRRRRARRRSRRPRRAGARFLYLLPNFQNPTGRTMTEDRRAALSRRAPQLGPADRRRQPLRRPLVRRAAAAAADRAQSGRLHLPGLVLQGAGAGPAPGLHGRAEAALSQAAAGQAGGRPAQPRASTSA